MEKSSVKNKILVEVDRYRQIDQGIYAGQKQSYTELIEDMNKDVKAIE